MMMKKLRVLIDTHDLYVAQTGIKTYIYELIDALKEHNDMDVIAVPSPGKITLRTGFKKGNALATLTFHFYTLIWKQVLLPFLVMRKRADVLICPDYFAPIWRLRARKLVVFHDAFFWQNPQHYNRRWLSYFKKMIQWGLSGNSTVVTVSHASAKQLRAKANLSCPIEVAETGYQAPKWSIKTTPMDFDFFLHIGVFEKRKNLQLLVRAFSSLKKDLPGKKLKLILVGNQKPKAILNDFPAVENLIKELNLEEDVICPGHLDPEVLQQYRNNALAYVFPSVSEGFGLPVLEAFGYQLPVITSNDPALAEIGGGATLVVENNEGAWVQAMKKILDDPDLRDTMVKEGLERLQYFSRESFAHKYHQIMIS